jgi:hypothetical protein
MKPNVSLLCFWQPASEHYPQPLKSPPNIHTVLLQNPFWYYRPAKPTSSHQVFLSQFNMHFLNLPDQDMNGDSINMSLQKWLRRGKLDSNGFWPLPANVWCCYFDDCLCASNNMHARTNHFPYTFFHLIFHTLLQKWEDIKPLEDNFHIRTVHLDISLWIKNFRR